MFDMKNPDMKNRDTTSTDLIGKFVFFRASASLSVPTLTAPCLVISQTTKTVDCTPLNITDNTNYCCNPKDEVEWRDIPVPSHPVYKDVNGGSRISHVLYVADTLEEAMTLYNASRRAQRAMDIVRRQQAEIWNEVCAKLSAPTS